MSETVFSARGFFRMRAMLLGFVQREPPLALDAGQRERWLAARSASERDLLAGRQLLRAGNARAAEPLLRAAARALWPLWLEEERARAATAAGLSERDRESLERALLPLEQEEEPSASSHAELDERATRLRDALTELTALAAHALDSERTRGLRASARRVYLALSLVAIVAFVVISAGAYHRFEPRNLALGAHVTASKSAFGTVPERVVDGFRYGQLGFASETQRDPWLTIDLGREEAIGRIVAYGRTDCCADQSIPLELGLSSDGIHFQPLARLEKPFTAFDPWEVPAPSGTRARYVRFVTRKSGYLVLSEVEIQPGK